MTSSSLYKCRLCLKDSQFCYSLFDEDVTEIIESFTSVKIEQDDELPAICCSQCLEDIYVVDKIRSRIIESDKILKGKRSNRVSSQGTEESSEDVKDETTVTDTSSVKVEEAVIKNETDLSTLEEKIDITIDPLLDDNLAVTDKDSGFFECADCNKYFSSERTYKAHVAKHSFLSVCKICNIQVLRTNYRKHLQIHVSGPQVCELCGAIAKNAESLRGHMFYMHKSTAEQYQCKQCGKFYRYKYKYKLHLRKAHGGDRTYICEVCAKAFYTARDVNRHIQMTHMKLRPYICQYCNKGFSSSYARRTHVRQHTNEKPFSCEICAEAFRQRVSLKTHLKSKHGVVQTADNSAAAAAKPTKNL